MNEAQFAEDLQCVLRFQVCVRVMHLKLRLGIIYLLNETYMMARELRSLPGNMKWHKTHGRTYKGWTAASNLIVHQPPIAHSEGPGHPHRGLERSSSRPGPLRPRTKTAALQLAPRRAVPYGNRNHFSLHLRLLALLGGGPTCFAHCSALEIPNGSPPILLAPVSD